MPSRNIEEALVKYLLSLSTLTTANASRIEPVRTGQLIATPNTTVELMEDKPIAGAGINRCVFEIQCNGTLELDVNTMYYFLAGTFAERRRVSMDGIKVPCWMINGYQKPQNPMPGSDVYTYSKSLFIVIQYAPACFL